MPAVDSCQGSVLHQAFARFAEKPALIDVIGGRRFTFRELLSISDQLRRKLSKSLLPETRILLLQDNSAELIVSYLSVLSSGAVSVPINPKLSDLEVHQIVRSSGATLALADRKNASRLPAGIPSLCWSTDLSLDEFTAQDIDIRNYSGSAPDRLAHVFFTSGTTGTPKGVPMRSDRLFAHARNFVRLHELENLPRFYNTLSLTYAAGWYNLCLVPWFAGAAVVLDREFGMNGVYSFWSNVIQHDVSALWLTPSMLVALNRIGLRENISKEQLAESVKWTMVGMAPLQVETKEQFENLFGLRLQQSYGLTETLLFASWMNDHSTPARSVGKILEGYDVTLEPATDEILVRGPGVFEGYWGAESPEGELFTTDGYFRTGDRGKFDERGNLHLVGRIREMIIRAGVKIFPSEVEEILRRIPGVEEVAVVGAPDEIYGERVVAFVRKSSSRPSALDIIKYARHHLKNKAPSQVLFVDEMPLNASGKLQKLELRKRVEC